MNIPGAVPPGNPFFDYPLAGSSDDSQTLMQQLLQVAERPGRSMSPAGHAGIGAHAADFQVCLLRALGGDAAATATDDSASQQQAAEPDAIVMAEPDTTVAADAAKPLTRNLVLHQRYQQALIRLYDPEIGVSGTLNRYQQIKETIVQAASPLAQEVAKDVVLLLGHMLERYPQDLRIHTDVTTLADNFARLLKGKKALGDNSDFARPAAGKTKVGQFLTRLATFIEHKGGVNFNQMLAKQVVDHYLQGSSHAAALRIDELWLPAVQNLQMQLDFINRPDSTDTLFNRLAETCRIQLSLVELLNLAALSGGGCGADQPADPALHGSLC